MNIDQRELKKKKNLILLTVDCLRADHLGCLGHEKNISPHLDTLAEDGILFTNAISNGFNTLYSVPSFLTSMLPPVNDKVGPTIAELLTKHKYHTLALNPNPVILFNLPGDVTPGDLGLDKGFDNYDVMLPGKQRVGIVNDLVVLGFTRLIRRVFNDEGKLFDFIYHIYDKAVKRFPHFFSTSLKAYLPTAEKLNNEAIERIKKHDEEPFFLWIHYMDCHEPYLSHYYDDKDEMMYLLSKYRNFPTKLTEKEIKKIHGFYEDTIKYTDKAIGSFIEKLKGINHYEDTIIILTADHGDAFGEHDTLGHGDKFIDQLYDEILHVPLIIHGVGKDTIERQVQLLDLAPTICDFFNIPKPYTFDGSNLFKSTKKEEGAISVSRHAMSYRTLNHKLILKKDKQKNKLYNLKTDPQEQHDIYEKDKETAQQLEKELVAELTRVKTKQEKRKVKTAVSKLKQKKEVFYK